MIFNNKPIVIATVMGVLLVQSVVSHAVTYTLSTLTTAQATAGDDTFVAGRLNDGGTAHAVDAILTPGAINPVTASTNFNYGTVAAVDESNTVTTGDTWSSQVSDAKYEFTVTTGTGANSITRWFVVDGTIKGSDYTTINPSQTGGTSNYLVNSITVYTNQGLTQTQSVTTVSNATPLPGSSNKYEGALNVTFGTNQSINIYVLQDKSFTASTSLGGYIQINVPEPGALPLAIGAGTAGLASMWNRRRIKRG